MRTSATHKSTLPALTELDHEIAHTDYACKPCDDADATPNFETVPTD